MQKYSNTIEVSHLLLKGALRDAKIVVDATCGNGNDTLFLAVNAPKAQIYAFDIQQEAIENTKRKTIDYKNRIEYICDSHSNVKKYITADKKIDAAMFNLGYLPKANHSLTTDNTTTLAAVSIVLDQLQTNGVISILAYPGHMAGNEEYMSLLKYTQKLDKHIYTVGWYQLHNHQNAPALCWIEKQG
ncbi:class I SAM-dependent methyltransferase [Pectinatus brassicae]|uniref:tRNA1(Val) A37 N6-methylase TrmN6 n=1 Tax=Pectinatus brassicae TaxID=862415 RepID=A0A840UJL7_9FIRM|nr:class I SAM-dependent methyltransferase [Pectinatus brassicae]MBB5336380.1 tRNA1(Val) A37 N6-methylase TrmN6 [Pectinatus brassicae]